MASVVNFPNMKLEHVRAHPNMDIIAALGYRSCVIINSSLDILQQYIDSNKAEKFYCCAFATLKQSQLLTKVSKSPSLSNGMLSRRSTASHESSGSPSSTNGALDGAQRPQQAARPSTETENGRGSKKGRRRHFICLAGEAGIIKLIDRNTLKLEGYLKGHTGPVYDLISYRSLLISCSGDSSIRIWDISTMKCIGVLGGLGGHKDHIFSICYSEANKTLASSGTDLVIKQWAMDLDKIIESGCEEYGLIQRPMNNFRNVHNSSIQKVLYYGNLIMSMAVGNISAIYNNGRLETINQIVRSFTQESEKDSISLDADVPIFIGNVESYDGCKNFQIVKHILVGLGGRGEIYLYDLRELGIERTPFIIETKIADAENFEVMDDHIYITTGSAVHKYFLDLSRFNDVS